jgi:hypothetical protein
MNKYKKLRKQVSQKKATKVSRRQAKLIQKDKPHLRTPKNSTAPFDKVSTATEEKNPLSDSIAAKSYESLAEAVEELKEFIHAELSVLRQEIKILKRSR